MPPATSEPSVASRFDLILVGGGLQNGLIALACLHAQPRLRLALVEREASLGGNHTWSIHPLDVPASAKVFVEPLVAHRWAGYDVQFPNRVRTLNAPYAAITSERFGAVVSAAFERSAGSRLCLGRTAQVVASDRVVLDDGETLYASLVIEARGPAAHLAAPVFARAPEGALQHCGFQKFLGLELELEQAHGLARPILMDATVPQTDGFRFFYVLPFSPTRLLVEDTVFSRSAVFDLDRARTSALTYAERFSRVTRVVREETGILPMPWARDPSQSSTSVRSSLVAGYQGGWFHPATGYSFPVAVRLACHVAKYAPDRVFGSALHSLRREHESQVSYAELLNRMLFNWFAPSAMWNVFERFYGMPEALIHRFYALSLTRLDQARILTGAPPRGLSLAYALSGAP